MMGFSREDMKWLGRWGRMMNDPLVDTQSRIECEEHLLDITLNHPHHVAAMLAGATASTIRSLPHDDPWRHINLVNGAPLMEGGERLDVDAATDITQLGDDDLRSDPALAPLYEGIDEAAQLLVAEAGKGWGPAYTMLTNLFNFNAMDVAEASAMLTSAVRAFRWAAVRRRCYMGRDEFWVTESLVNAMAFADAAVSGDELIMRRLDNPPADQSVEPGAWAALVDPTEYDPYT
jgi:hypothetical protein